MTSRLLIGLLIISACLADCRASSRVVATINPTPPVATCTSSTSSTAEGWRQAYLREVDATERWARIAKRRAAKRKEAEESNRLLEKRIATLEHELVSPSTVAAAFTPPAPACEATTLLGSNAVMCGLCAGGALALERLLDRGCR